MKEIMEDGWSSISDVPFLMELDWACTDIPAAFHDWLLSHGVGAWTFDTQGCHAPGTSLQYNAYDFYVANYSAFPSLLVLDSWNDVNRWPCYESAADLFGLLGTKFKPRWFELALNGSPHQQEVIDAATAYWSSVGGVWPFSELPTAWAR